MVPEDPQVARLGDRLNRNLGKFTLVGFRSGVVIDPGEIALKVLQP